MNTYSRYLRFRKGEAEIKRNLHGQVVHELGIKIMRGDLKPGETLLPEEELACGLGVSRSLVREAVKSISAKGMIESRTRIGLRVTPRSNWNFLDLDVLGWYYSTTPSEKFMSDLYAVRWIVEPAAAERAADWQAPLTLARLKRPMLICRLPPVRWSLMRPSLQTFDFTKEPLLPVRTSC